jgi:hypothetical protein
MSERLIRRLTSLYATLASQSKSYDAEAVREAIDALGKTPSALTRPAVGDDVERVAEIIHDFLDERFPDGALPGGRQLFADDALDAEFKHEAGCTALAERILSSIPDMQEVERLREALVKVKDRCWEADEANWQHDILSIVVPITDALHTPEPTP